MLRQAEARDSFVAFDAGDRFVKFRVSGEQQGQECEAGWIVERTAGRETLSFPGRQRIHVTWEG